MSVEGELFRDQSVFKSLQKATDCFSPEVATEVKRITFVRDLMRQKLDSGGWPKLTADFQNAESALTNVLATIENRDWHEGFVGKMLRKRGRLGRKSIVANFLVLHSFVILAIAAKRAPRKIANLSVWIVEWLPEVKKEPSYAQWKHYWTHEVELCTAERFRRICEHDDVSELETYVATALEVFGRGGPAATRLFGEQTVDELRQGARRADLVGAVHGILNHLRTGSRLTKKQSRKRKTAQVKRLADSSALNSAPHFGDTRMHMERAT